MLSDMYGTVGIFLSCHSIARLVRLIYTFYLPYFVSYVASTQSIKIHDNIRQTGTKVYFGDM